MRLERSTAWDAIVVGAGPSGSTCAFELASRGHRVLLVERDSSPGASANCTGIIGIEGFEAFEIPRDQIVSSISSLRFVGPRDERLAFEPSRTLAHVVRRHRFDAALARRAVDAGAALRCETRVLGPVEGASGLEGGVVVVADTPEGPAEIRGRAVVIATGYNVGLLRRFGIEASPSFLQGIQMLAPSSVRHPVTVLTGSERAPGSFAWIVPLEPGWMKVGLTTRVPAQEYLERLIETCFLDGTLRRDEARTRCSPIPVGTPRSTVADRTLVVGEAAGQVKATTSGGIYWGMLGGRIAGEVLDEALRRDRLSAAALAEYERRWRALFASEIRSGIRLRATFENMSDGTVSRLFQIGSQNGVMKLVHQKADFDWHRRLILGLVSHPSLRPLFQKMLQPV